MGRIAAPSQGEVVAAVVDDLAGQQPAHEGERLVHAPPTRRRVDPAVRHLRRVVAAHPHPEDQPPRCQLGNRRHLSGHGERMTQGEQVDGGLHRDPAGERGEGGGLEQAVVALATLERHVVPDPEAVESGGLGRGREARQPVRHRRRTVREEPAPRLLPRDQSCPCAKGHARGAHAAVRCDASGRCSMADDEAQRLIGAAWRVLERSGYEGFKVQLVMREADGVGPDLLRALRRQGRARSGPAARRDGPGGRTAAGPPWRRPTSPRPRSRRGSTLSSAPPPIPGGWPGPGCSAPSSAVFSRFPNEVAEGTRPARRAAAPGARTRGRDGRLPLVQAGPGCGPRLRAHRRRDDGSARRPTRRGRQRRRRRPRPPSCSGPSVCRLTTCPSADGRGRSSGGAQPLDQVGARATGRWRTRGPRRRRRG